MNDLVNLFMNAGVTVVVLAYFIYRDYKFSEKLNSSLTTLNDTTNLIKDLLIKEEREEKKDGT